ncbi:hypothetical protein [Modestobacter lapidis]|nr:hypothetical protein [Modestobacter lapidis]
MSSPRDRDPDDAGDPAGDAGRDGPDWQEPAHLGRPDGPDGPDGPGTDPADRSDGSTAWQPPGWDLPAVEPDRPRTAPPEPAQPAPEPPPGPAPEPPSWHAPAAEQRQDDVPPPVPEQPPARRGLFGGMRRPRRPSEFQEVFRREDDPVGVQAWGLSHGWVPSDGSAPEDAPLADLVRSAPVRPSKDHRPGNVIRGRGMGLDLVAFDVVYASGRMVVPQWAVTAAPVLGDVPAFRLSPARLWKHGTGGLVQIPSGDPEFDTRWVLLTAADGPQVRRLVEDPVVRQLLLGTDDGDELWSAAGFVAAVRPDGHRPQLVEHHARLLAVVVGALATAG